MALNLYDHSSLNQETLKQIDIYQIKPSPKNRLGIRRIEELMDSIVHNGLIEPIIIRQIMDLEYPYEIIEGERRFTAYKRLYEEGVNNPDYQEYRKILCIVMGYMSDDEAEELLIEAAAEKRDLNTEEKLYIVKKKTEIYQKRMDAGEVLPVSITEMIAKDTSKIGVKGEQVRRYRNINKAIPEVQTIASTGELDILTASRVHELPEEKQLEVVKLVKSEPINKKELSAKVDTLIKEDKYSEGFIKKMCYSSIKLLLGKEEFNKLHKNTRIGVFKELISKHLGKFNQSTPCLECRIESISIKDQRKVIQIDFVDQEMRKDKIQITVEDAFYKIKEYLPTEDEMKQKIKVSEEKEKLQKGFEYVEELLRNHLSTKVEVTDKYIKILHYGTADVNRILDILNVRED